LSRAPAEKPAYGSAAQARREEHDVTQNRPTATAASDPLASVFVEISNLCLCGGEGTCHACRAVHEFELAMVPFHAARQEAAGAPGAGPGDGPTEDLPEIDP